MCSKAIRSSRTTRSRTISSWITASSTAASTKWSTKFSELREETGDFGELVYAGMDWVDPALAKRSMQLLAEQVLPRVNEAIGKRAAAE